MSSLRTKSREFAMQMLFQWDMSQQDPAKLEAKFWRAAKAADTTRAFANRLFEGAGDMDNIDVFAFGTCAIESIDCGR